LSVRFSSIEIPLEVVTSLKQKKRKKIKKLTSKCSNFLETNKRKIKKSLQNVVSSLKQKKLKEKVTSLKQNKTKLEVTSKRCTSLKQKRK
jgi:hypothetical protein